MSAPGMGDVRLGDLLARFLLEQGRLTAGELQALLGDRGASEEADHDFIREAFARRLVSAQEFTELLRGVDAGEEAAAAESAGPGGVERLGRYEVVRELGGGGMGRVLLAEDRFLGRTVALKVIRGEPEERLVRRFVREARINGQLTHPNVVPVHDFGVTDEGLPFIAMKEVKGRTLTQVLDDRRGDPDAALPELLRAFIKVCDAMAFAHAQGIIHRDLKPDNLMLGEFGEVLVVDWGLARGVRDARPESSEVRVPPEAPAGLTMEGEVMGTLPYMSPEQAMGQRALDRRSDVYALGAILYQILCGEPPFTGERWQEVRAAVIRGGPPPPSQRSPLRRIPWELESLVMRTLDRNPLKRPADAAALGRDVAAYLEERALDSVRYSGGQLLVKWVRQQRRRLAALSVAGLALLLVGGYTLRRGLQARRRSAELEQRTLSLGAAEAAALRGESRYRALRDQTSRWTAGFLDLADELRLERLEAEAELFGPQRWKSAGMRRWLAQVGPILAREKRHRDALRRLEQAAQRQPRDADGAWRLARRRAVVALLERTRSRIGTVREHLRQASRAAALPVASEARWARASRQIRASPRYGGLELSPQEGLHPLGPDPVSGLWEFAHLPSGRPAVRGADGSLRVGPETGIVLVLLPGGRLVTNRKGRDDPYFTSLARQERVSVGPFLISKYELTKAQARRCLAGHPDRALREAEMRRLPDEKSGGRLMFPALLEWRVARKVLLLWGLDLPTEVQWEFAARGGTTTPWWTGDRPESLAESENVADLTLRTFLGIARKQLKPEEYEKLWAVSRDATWRDGFAAFAPVDRLRANPFGLHHVLGNVSEWCRDAFSLHPWLFPPSGPEGVRRLPASSHGMARGGTALTHAWRCTAYWRKPTTEADKVRCGIRPIRRIIR